ncbi:MAG TPA: hypothetical protein VNC78_07295 [Actinomycetota bacterium]|nr:hypothetical protein [Actinomycetota bacterium]
MASLRARLLHSVAGVVAALIASLVVAAPGAAHRRQVPLSGEGKGLELVANIEYLGGTDMELFSRGDRDYAVTGSAPGVGGAEAGAMRIIDITVPERPVLISMLECSLYQMDVQLSSDRNVAILGADAAGEANACAAMGRAGFMTVDISDVEEPKVLGFAEIPRGSHNITAHPTQPFVYNSDSDALPGQIQIWSIADPRHPELVNTVSSFPSSPHDIAFNKDGSLAVTAAKRQIDLFDTTDPAHPVELHKALCAGCALVHDAQFTPDGKRVIVGDEAGGGGAYPCPGGALYFYSVQSGTDGPVLVPTGAYMPDEIYTARDDQSAPDSCTSHVFDIAPDGQHIAVSWYSAGTRYLDISSTTGVTWGGSGVGASEEAWFMPDGGLSWASKFHKGPYIYSSDMQRGFDVYRIVD